MSGGKRIDDHKFWAGSKSKETVLPRGVHFKDESSAEGAGELNKFEDTTEAIRAAQTEGTRKAKAHSSRPEYRN